MRDELFDRDYQAARAHLNGSIDGALRKARTELAKVFKAVHRVEWSAPWMSRTR